MPQTNTQRLASDKPLESWKEIAAHLQRNVATVQRWEKNEGLPIHRHSHSSRSSVYAYPSEIDAWRASRKVIAEVAAAPVSTIWRVPTFALAIILCLIMVGNGVRPEAASAKDGPLAKRLVCSDCVNPESGGLSKDGRWMVYNDLNSFDLVRRDMQSGKVERLIAGTNDGAAVIPVLSPDNRQVAYSLVSGDGDRLQLRLTPNQPGGKQQVLVDSPDYPRLVAMDWFPDGKSVLAVVEKRGGSYFLARVSVPDGRMSVLKSLEGLLYPTFTAPPRVSPDGRYIAYGARAVSPSKPPAPTDPQDTHIYILGADGSRDTEIVKGAGRNENPSWTPDGKRIVFTSDRFGKVDLWSIPVEDGKAAGAESLVSRDYGGALGVGFAGRSYYYVTDARSEYVRIARLSPGGNNVEEQSMVGIAPTWSPDGKSLAFKRHDPVKADRYGLVIHSLETGQEKAPLAGIGNSGDGTARWWSPESIITGVVRDQSPVGVSPGPTGAYRIDTKSGDLKMFLPQGNCGLDTLSPDEKTLYVRCGPRPSRVVARDAATGQERVLGTYPNPPLITALSPDGRTVAIGWNEPSTGKLHIFRVSTDGSGYREVFTGDGRSNAQAVAWDRDGRSILFSQKLTGRSAVMRVPADGGPASPVLYSTRDITAFDVSPDGARIAYSSNELSSELWALDNVLPTLK